MLTGDLSFVPLVPVLPSIGPAPSVARRIPVEMDWPAAPANDVAEFDVRVRPWHDERSRLQQVIDGLDSQVAVLDLNGDIIAVNRAWRLTAKMQGMAHSKTCLGYNYLAVCGTAAAEGVRDAAITAEGIEGIMQGRSRSFFYKYRVRLDAETRLYALLAWRITDGGCDCVAVSHELLEAHFSG